MKELEKLQKQGWRFAIWLKPGGGCIIQGTADDKEDWDFDILADNFGLAAKQAIWEVKMRQRKMEDKR